MPSNINELLKTADIKTPLIGLYDTPDAKPFEPFTEIQHCLFAAYENWHKGESIVLSDEKPGCKGSGYWLCGTEGMPRDKFVDFLANKEGLKSSPEVMNQWLEIEKPYQREHAYVVIGPLNDEQFKYLKTITFFVNPDQLSLLLTGVEYKNASPKNPQVITKFGSGCAQLVALFEDLNVPKAIIGSTDIAMRQHLPPDILTLTVTIPMFEQLCELNENSFLHKPFWKNLRKARANNSKPT